MNIGNVNKRAMLGAIAHIAGIENPTFEGAKFKAPKLPERFG